MIYRTREMGIVRLKLCNFSAKPIFSHQLHHRSISPVRCKDMSNSGDLVNPICYIWFPHNVTNQTIKQVKLQIIQFLTNWVALNQCLLTKQSFVFSKFLQTHQLTPGSSKRGRIGNELSLSTNDHHQQWQSGPHMFATAAASSGFPQQIRSSHSQNWLQNNGFHSLVRPS